MDWDGKVEQPKLVCAASGRALAPGEVFFSGLRLSDGVFARSDFAAETWDAQDKTAFLSWWRQSVPEADRKRRVLKLDAVSLGRIFADLKEARDRPSQCFCYVVALCLARMRKLRILEVEKRDGESFLLLQDRANEAVHRLRDPRMSAAEEDQVRRNLMDVITLDGPSVVAAPSAAESDPS
jgi:hypothetical protein